MPMRYLNPKTGQYQNSPYDPQADERNKARLQALQSIGSIGGGSNGGVMGGAMSGAGTGMAIGNMIAPGAGGLIGAGIGGIVGGIGAGIEGGQKNELENAKLDIEKRKMDYYERGQNLDQLNEERKQGLEGIKYLAQSRSDAIQRRNRSLFANDLMRVLG